MNVTAYPNVDGAVGKGGKRMVWERTIGKMVYAGVLSMLGGRWKVMWSEGMRRTEGLSVGNVEVLKDVI